MPAAPRNDDCSDLRRPEEVISRYPATNSGTAAALLALLLPIAVAQAVPPDAVEPGRTWQIGSVAIHGNDAVPESKLREAMLTQPRPWYRMWEFWRPRPPFDPVVFRDDVDRIRQVLRTEGYYHARVTADVQVPEEGDVLDLVVEVDEGPPVRVTTLDVELSGEPLPADQRETLLGALPIKEGAIFRQEDYARTATMLNASYREHGYARVQLERSAEVDVRTDTATVRYRVASGPVSVFGPVEITGLEKVEPDVVENEVAFEEGQPFRQTLLDETRRRLVATKLFRTIRMVETGGDDPTVGIRIEVAEGPQHEVALGIGYDTEEQARGLATWRAYNFFGGGRQVGFSARASFINRTVALDFIQPHVPRKGDRLRVVLSKTQEEEETYTNDRSRFSPRVEFRTLPILTCYAFYRFEYDSLSDVNETVRTVFPEIAPKNSLLSGFGFGADLNMTDDLLDPHRGWAASLGVEPVGGILGGDFEFIRILADARRYQPLPWSLTLAVRLRAGFADPYAGGDIPLFERFYAGGINSVRGYERRHVGPMVDGDPIGGRSLIEGSAELRRPLKELNEALSVAVFFDAGQVSTESFDVPLGDLRYGLGFGVGYKTPVGPLRLDLGFPTDAPRGDSSWQIHVSIGQTF